MLTVEQKMLHYTVYAKQNVRNLLKNCKENKNTHITDIIQAPPPHHSLARVN
jgi:hypothetical protein